MENVSNIKSSMNVQGTQTGRIPTEVAGADDMQAPLKPRVRPRRETHNPRTGKMLQPYKLARVQGHTSVYAVYHRVADGGESLVGHIKKVKVMASHSFVACNSSFVTLEGASSYKTRTEATCVMYAKWCKEHSIVNKSF